MTLPSRLTGRLSRWIETTQDQLGAPNLNKLGFASSPARHTGCDGDGWIQCGVRKKWAFCRAWHCRLECPLPTILLDERASIRSTPFGQEVRSSGMLGMKPARQGGTDTCNVARKFYIGSIPEAEGWKSARPMARSPQSGRVSTWTYSITWSAMR